MKPGIYQMTAEEYHANPEGLPFLSNSAIYTLINESPLHAWHEHSALNPNYVAEQEEKGEDKKFDVGIAAHSVILEGVDNIVELDFKDWRTNASKEQADLIRLQGMTPLLRKHAQAVRQMAAAAHKEIAECKELCGLTLKDGKPEQTLIWQDEETGVWCKARPDWVHEDHKLMLDLKSTQASAEPNQSTRRVMDQMQAYVQAAWYKRGLKAITGNDADFIFLCQESKRPFAACFINTTNSYLALGESKISIALPLWAKCLRENKWPGYSGRIHQPEPAPWSVRDWMERLNEESEGEME
jgi:hypothetical protein